MMGYDTLIVSDIHLGSPYAMAQEVLSLLRNTEFKRLILLGDVFSDLNFGRLTKEHWQLISYIRKLSNPKREVEVVWVEGNHDYGIAPVMEHLIGVKVFQKYTWEWNGKKLLALHGHQFDSLFAEGPPWFNGLLNEVHFWIQGRESFKKWLPKILDKLHTSYQRLTKKVADGAFRSAIQEGAPFVFCGHTHQAYHEIRDSVEYWNTGCWVTGAETTYITLGDEGIQLHTLKKGVEQL